MNYLDTSAFVKYYREEEEGSNKVNELIENAKAGNEQLISSFFIVGEVVSVFDKWVRYKYISNKECNELVRIFLGDIKNLTDNGVLILEPVSTFTITHCLELITEHHLSVNDAIHLYTSLSNKTHIKKFISSDEILLKAAEAEGFEVFNPEEDN